MRSRARTRTWSGWVMIQDVLSGTLEVVAVGQPVDAVAAQHADERFGAGGMAITDRAHDSIALEGEQYPFGVVKLVGEAER